MTRLFGPYAYSDAPIARNFWARAVPDHVLERPALSSNTQTDTVIIGAGFTGLNAALALAEAGRDVIVIDARFPGWGASGRNGGFCCLGGTRARPATLDRRFGQGAADEVHAAERAAIGHVAQILIRFDIDADRHSDGETCLAHTPAKARDMARHPDWQAPEALRQRGMSSSHFGGVTAPEGFALHPRKYLRGLLEACESAGARVFGNTPAQTLSSGTAGWHVQTPAARINARHVVLALNGYASEALLPWLRGRYLPAQSSIIASRAMTQEELSGQGWTARQMAYEDRRLLHYFHLTPDAQMIFGMRGGLRSSPVADRKLEASLRRDFEALFPRWRDVDTPDYWSGMVCATASLTPFCGPIPGHPGAFTAFGYHGNGVAMGSYLGARLADLILGRAPTPVLPRAFRAPPPRFPFGRWRRVLLALEYSWAKVTRA